MADLLPSIERLYLSNRSQIFNHVCHFLLYIFPSTLKVLYDFFTLIIELHIYFVLQTIIKPFYLSAGIFWSTRLRFHHDVLY